MNEFDLIDVILQVQRDAETRAQDAARAADEDEPVPLQRMIVGPGDDAAVVRSVPGCDWLLSTDTLVEGRHFPAGLPPYLVGRRALAVNLSDLAAMGADPGAYLVALTHPELDAEWAREFARGLLASAADTGARLVGGNLSRGPLSVTVTVTGTTPSDAALLRSGARAGDLLYVSGRIGLAHLGLARLAAEPGLLEKLALDDLPADLAALLTPTPRIALGRALRGRASACIDVSDGLMGDLTHLCRRSGVGARVLLERVPTDGDAAAAVVAGDDYQLLFTLPAEAEAELAEVRAAADCELHRIGRITEATEVLLLDGEGEPVPIDRTGWSHF